MITLALIQGVVNTFVVFLSRIVGHFVDRVILKNERGHGLGYWVSSIVAQILLGILASMIVTWFSRRREFRADEGGALYAGRENMIAALEALKGGTAELPDMKRIGLFLLTNIAVMAVIAIIFSVFGIGNVLDEQGVNLDLGALLVYSAVIGFTGSIISLAISKPMAKWQTGAKIIDEARDPDSQ